MERGKGTEGVRKLWEKYRFVGLVMLAGVLVLMWPDGSRSSPSGSAETEAESVCETERRMEEILSAISGVGQVRVMLTLDSDGERQLARDEELSYRGAAQAPEDYSRRSETVLTDGAEGERSLVTRRVYPAYRGALVVCQGGERAEVRLTVTQAVTSLTGLSADRVTVAKWQ